MSSVRNPPDPNSVSSVDSPQEIYLAPRNQFKPKNSHNLTKITEENEILTGSICQNRGQSAFTSYHPLPYVRPFKGDTSSVDELPSKINYSIKKAYEDGDNSKGKVSSSSK